MADLATLQARLTAAEAAYHSVVTGTKVERVDTGQGYSTAYTRANAAELLGYINRLKAEIAALGGGGRRRSGVVINLPRTV